MKPIKKPDFRGPVGYLVDDCALVPKDQERLWALIPAIFADDLRSRFLRQCAENIQHVEVNVLKSAAAPISRDISKVGKHAHAALLEIRNMGSEAREYFDLRLKVLAAGKQSVVPKALNRALDAGGGLQVREEQAAISSLWDLLADIVVAAEFAAKLSSGKQSRPTIARKRAIVQAAVDAYRQVFDGLPPHGKKSDWFPRFVVTLCRCLGIKCADDVIAGVIDKADARNPDPV